MRDEHLGKRRLVVEDAHDGAPSASRNRGLPLIPRDFSTVPIAASPMRVSHFDRRMERKQNFLLLGKLETSADERT